MNKRSIVLALAVFVLLGAAGFAAERCVAARAARDARDAAQGRLERAVKLSREHPELYGPGAPASVGRVAALKTLVQECATERNVTIGYLSESERDAEKGGRERQVLIRLVNVGHPNVVRFLQQLEQRSGGATIKELHVRPSREIPDSYEEAEVVLSRISATSKEKGP